MAVSGTTLRLWKAGLLLSTALVAAPVVAHAQDVEATDQTDPVAVEDAGEPAGMDDVIVVTGTPIRDSQAAAIEAKRLAPNILDVVSADTIGRFPDQNLADSLGRVSGLAIERDQGQARFINFRGAPFRFTSIAFDGIDVPGAENGRIPRFDAFPSAITREIRINKAVTPDMPGEAVAGFIDIRTFTPFDRGDGFHFSIEGGYGNQELGDVGIEKVNGRLFYAGENWGVLVFGSHNKRGRITDNREYELEVDPETNGIIPANLDFRSYRGEREDNSYGGNAEYRFGDTGRIFVSSIFSEFLDREERNQFDFDIADGAAAAGGIPLTPDVGYQPLVLVTRVLEDGLYTNSTWTSTLGADFAAYGWDIEARLNYTETTNDTLLPLPFSVGGQVAAAYDVTDIENPQVELFEPFTMNPTDINSVSYALDLGIIFGSTLDTENYKIKADATREIDVWGYETIVKTGFQIDIREATGGDGLVQGLFPAGVDIDSFNTGEPWSSDFDNTIGATDYDNVGLRDAWERAQGGEFSIPQTPDSLIGIDETIYAVYGMGTTAFNWGSVVYGARVEVTDFETSGTRLVDGVEEPTSADNQYTHFLPSLHVNVDLLDDLKLRVSGTTGVSRPTYSEARASVSFDPIELQASGGNPDLDAEFAYGADVSLEWYFAEGSLLSIGGYARFIDNVIYPDTIILNNGAGLSGGLVEPGTPVIYNSFFNGEDGELYGLELSFIGQATFLPYPLDGFGVSGNLTLLDSEFTAPTRPGGTFSLPGTSDLIYNVSVYYEKFGISARVNYQYRDDWLSTTENDSLTEFWAETKRLDASVRYTVPFDVYGATVTLFADGNNLSDERDTRYVNSIRTPNQVEGFGRRYIFGARIDY